ncbi:unnamed protein product [Closterium sp. NIES-53]
MSCHRLCPRLCQILLSMHVHPCPCASILHHLAHRFHPLASHSLPPSLLAPSSPLPNLASPPSTPALPTPQFSCLAQSSLPSLKRHKRQPTFLSSARPFAHSNRSQYQQQQGGHSGRQVHVHVSGRKAAFVLAPKHLPGMNDPCIYAAPVRIAASNCSNSSSGTTRTVAATTPATAAAASAGGTGAATAAAADSGGGDGGARGAAAIRASAAAASHSIDSTCSAQPIAGAHKGPEAGTDTRMETGAGAGARVGAGAAGAGAGARVGAGAAGAGAVSSARTSLPSCASPPHPLPSAAPLVAMGPDGRGGVQRVLKLSSSEPSQTTSQPTKRKLVKGKPHAAARAKDMHRIDGYFSRQQ